MVTVVDNNEQCLFSFFAIILLRCRAIYLFFLLLLYYICYYITCYEG